MPITKIYFFDYFSNDLFPFAGSINKLVLNKASVLELIEESATDSPLFDDIFKVKIVEGPHKNKIGYVFENNLALHRKKSKKDIDIISYAKIKEDGKLILKSKKYKLKDIVTDFGPPYYMAEDEDGNITKLTSSTNIVFLPDKKSEITFYKNNNKKVIKLIDGITLLPISGATINKIYVTDEFGFAYINKSTQYKLNINKKGYLAESFEISNKTDLLLMKPDNFEDIHYEILPILENGDEKIDFDENSPYYVTQELYKNNSLIKKSSPKETPTSFHKLFYGNWREELIKENKINIKHQDKFEHLGNMILEEYNKVTFHINDTIYKGYIDIIAENKVIINIIYSNKFLESPDFGLSFKISPSLKDTQIKIPALYSFDAGIITFSFNEAFLSSFSLSKKTNPPKENKAKITSISFMPLYFPEEAKQCKYQILFYKTD